MAVKKNKICVVDSLYSLLLYILYNPLYKNDTIFVFGESIPESIKTKLDCRMVFPKYYNPITRLLLRINPKVLFLLFIAEEIYGHDHLSVSHVFLRKRFTVIEDGVGNYSNNTIREMNDISWIHKILFGIKPRLGLSPKVHKIVLTGIIKDIPIAIKDKVTIVDFYELLKKMDRNEILSLFELKLSEIKGDVLLLTQPFSEDGYISEYEKIEIYKDIAAKYIADKKVLIIKPHPRELTDYEGLIQGSVVLPSKFPIQLLWYFKGTIESAITISSSAVYSLPFIKQVEIIGSKTYTNLNNALNK